MQSSCSPKYEKVANAIRKDIMLGNYPVGSFLPTEPQLEKKYQVSRATVRTAIQLLVQEGLLKVRQGQGTKVLHKGSFSRLENVTTFSERIASPGFREEEQSIQICDIKEVPIFSQRDAEFLHLPSTGTVYQFQRLLKLGNCTYGIMTNYLPKHLVPNLPAYKGQFVDLYSFLRETYGIHYTRAEEIISAEGASLIESEIMGIPINTPLLNLRRIAYCDRGPLECSYSQIRSDIYKLHVFMNNE